jgi:hypothetical protein
MHIAEPLVPDPTPFVVEIAVKRLKRYKFAHAYQILIEMIQAGGRILDSEVHKLVYPIWNNELPQKWKEFIIVPIYKNGYKTDCRYREISLLPTTYNILSSILLSSLTPYIDKIIGEHHCRFQHNRSTADLRSSNDRKNGNKMG